jgi:hypothetical protein
MRSVQTTLAFIATALWLGVTWQIAESGALRRWNATSPTICAARPHDRAAALRLAFGPVGRRIAQTIPLWVLIGVQGFRLPLEIAMHGVYERGIMPLQNDVYGKELRHHHRRDRHWSSPRHSTAARGGPRWPDSGTSSVLLLLATSSNRDCLRRRGLALFGDANLNTFVTYAPFVWLPAVMVLAALPVHLVIFRAIASAGGSLWTRP